MSNQAIFTSRSGSVIFDFDNQKIIFDRGGSLSDSVGLISMEINMREITDIELRQPSFMKLGGFNVIVNGIRYVTKAGFDMTQFAIPQKSEFPALESALRKVLSICGISGFKAENSVNAPKEEFTGNDPGLVYSFTNNTNSTLKVFEDYLLIKHTGALNFMSKDGLKGEKRINYTAISSIECRKATTMAAGFIQFSIFGSDRAGGITSAAGDENSILFDAGKNNLAQQIVDYIEKRRSELSAPKATQVIQAASAADELKKFKELLDMGVISQEEFDAKKKQLLGL